MPAPSVRRQRDLIRMLLRLSAAGLACVACTPRSAPADPGAIRSPAHSGLEEDCGDAGVAAGGRCRTASGDVAVVPLRQPTGPGGGLARGTGEPADTLVREGDEALDRGELEAAREAYLEARRLAPGDPAPQVGLLRVRFAESGLPLSFGAAMGSPALRALADDAMAAIALDPTFAPAHLERGRLLLVLGDADAALASLRRAVELAVDDAEAQSALGVGLLATGDTAGAVARFRRASELSPDDPDRLTNLGTAYLMRGDVASALLAFERAVALAPDDARAQGNLGTAYLTANQPARARAHLERAVALAPSRATFRSNLGYAEELTGDLDLAMSSYRQALALDDQLGSAWINLGTVLARRGEYDEAERCFQRALAIDPSDPRARANMEELRELRGRGAGAPAEPPQGEP